MYRKGMRKGKSKRLFKKTVKPSKFNVMPPMTRGGVRL